MKNKYRYTTAIMLVIGALLMLDSGNAPATHPRLFVVFCILWATSAAMLLLSLLLGRQP